MSALFAPTVEEHKQIQDLSAPIPTLRQRVERQVTALARSVSAKVSKAPKARRLSRLENIKRALVLDENILKLPQQLISTHQLAMVSISRLRTNPTILERDYINPFGKTMTIDPTSILLNPPLQTPTPNSELDSDLCDMLRRQYDALDGPLKYTFAKSWE